jgi:hypothetical protein
MGCKGMFFVLFFIALSQKILKSVDRLATRGILIGQNWLFWGLLRLIFVVVGWAGLLRVVIVVFFV